MSKIDVEYHKLLNKILHDGYIYEDPNRKGVNRIEIPSYTFRHEFKDGFPAITTKKLNYKSVATELIWFLRGDTNIKYLVDNGCNIWNKDAYNYYKKIHNDWDEKYLMSLDEFIMCIKFSKKELVEYLDKSGQGFKGDIYNLGDLGPVYGAQWRKWDTKQSIVVGHNGSYNEFGTIIKDQISNLIKGLKERPLGTQHIVNAWNVGDLEDMALQPCHYGFQIVMRPLSLKERGDLNVDNRLRSEAALNDLNIPKYGFELHWSQRSVDTFLGLPFNIASYATLALILEKITGYKALAIQGDLKKVHLYDNSLDAVKEQLSRDVDKYDKCEMTFHGEEGTTMFDHYKDPFRKDIDLNQLFNTFRSSTFKLYNYESYPAINVEMLERNN